MNLGAISYHDPTFPLPTTEVLGYLHIYYVHVKKEKKKTGEIKTKKMATFRDRNT